MPALVTLETAKVQLRIGADDARYDTDILLRCDQATAVIVSYLGPATDPAWTAETVPADVQQALLVWVSHLYERGQVTTPEAGKTPADEEIWNATWRLLRRRRQDVIA